MEDTTNEGNQSGLLKRTRKITRVPIFNQDLIDENRGIRFHVVNFLTSSG